MKKNQKLYSNLAETIVLFFSCFILFNGCGSPESEKSQAQIDSTLNEIASLFKVEKYWIAPDTNLIQKEEQGELIHYGRQLIANTSAYFGPHGTVGQFTNGMNCQNCHLDAGSKVFGNNYSAVASTYPKFRPRSGSMESIEKRVNDCLSRSLNGHAIDSLSKEMKAIVSYIKWLGKGVKKGESPKGSGLVSLPFMDRPADPETGNMLYTKKCVSCHGTDGEGKPDLNQFTYQYPPLWGPHSYNTGAGLYRLSRFAGYIKANMPLGSSFENPQLTDEEAWDIAAFVNSQPRPEKKFSEDWPDISKKPYDHPFGPFVDGFSETQHKYGPFALMPSAQKKK